MLNKNVVIVDAERYEELISYERWATALEVTVEELNMEDHFYPRAKQIYEDIQKQFAMTIAQAGDI